MLKKLTFLLVWVALTVAILYFFYLSGSQGLTRIFLPLSFVAIVVSLIQGPVASVLVVLLGVIASFFATGLPSAQFMIPAVVESTVSGLSATFFYRKTNSLYLAILLAFLASRVLLIVLVYLFRVDFEIAMDLLIGLVGLGLQLVFIPMVHKILVKSFSIQNQKGGI